jgi:hypothetical protein
MEPTQLLTEYRGYNGRDVKLAVHRQLVPKLRTSAALLLLLHVPSYCAYGKLYIKYLSL